MTIVKAVLSATAPERNYGEHVNRNNAVWLWNCLLYYLNADAMRNLIS